MIKDYTAHSANERTYLAWIRTAIAIMGFGFLIEKFELFVVNLNKPAKNELDLQSSLPPEIVGLALMLVGVLVIISATVRFFLYKKAIESEEIFPYNDKKINIVLSILLILIGLFMLIYMVHIML